MCVDQDVRPEDIFECQLCGDCCQGYGGTYLTRDDIAAISHHVAVDRETFLSEYCVISGRRPMLKQGPDGYCIFWNKLCTIHPVKPRMCRQWPYLEAVLVEPSNWKAMASCCPGMRTDLPDKIVIAGVRAYLESIKP